jgi:hypothetical protein
MTDDLSTLLQPVHYRIQAYLSGGGLFNPELANHDAVRDLIIDLRTELLRMASAEAELAALKARIEAAEVFTCYAAIISGRDYDYISAILRHDDPAYQYPDLDGKRVQLLVEGWRETYSAVGFVPVAGVWTCVRHIALPDVRSWQHGQGLEHRLYDRPDMQRRGQRTCGRNHQRPRCQSRRASRNLGMPAVLVVGQDTTATL